MCVVINFFLIFKVLLYVLNPYYYKIVIKAQLLIKAHFLSITYLTILTLLFEKLFNKNIITSWFMHTCLFLLRVCVAPHNFYSNKLIIGDLLPSEVDKFVYRLPTFLNIKFQWRKIDLVWHHRQLESTFDIRGSIDCDVSTN